MTTEVTLRLHGLTWSAAAGLGWGSRIAPVLARLETIDGVAGAEVDHRGERLRLRLDRDAALSEVRRTLEELGYRVDDVSGGSGGAGTARWYGAASARDLSREEADVIARRVAPAVARDHGLDRAAGNELARAVADALYRCFAAHTLGAGVPPGALRDECVRSAEAAARPLLGPDGARELAAALLDDLDRREQEDGDG